MSASYRYSDIEKALLRKLYMDRRIGEKHTSIDNVPKGFPRHLRGEVKKAMKRLIRKGFILQKRTAYGLQVSLQPHRVSEIEKIIQDS